MKKVNELKLSFWKVLGTTKETILEVEDILDIGKTKSQRRSTEQTFLRFKNHKLSTKRFHEVGASESILFEEFCFKFIYKNIDKKKVHIKQFRQLYFTFFECYDMNYLPKLCIKYISFKLAVLMSEMKIDTSLFDISFSHMSYEEIINRMDLLKKESSIQKELSYINDKLKNRYSKNNIKINAIDEESFSVYLSEWKRGETPNLTQVMHILELISDESNRIEIFFQLLAFRMVFHIKRYLNLEEKSFEEFKIKYFSFLGILACASDNEVLKEKLFYENELYKYFLKDDRKKEFNLEIKDISKKEKVNRLFLEEKYIEVLYKNKYKEIEDKYEKIISYSEVAVINFIASVKSKDKAIIKKAFRDLSLVLMLEYRGMKYDSNKFIKLFENENNIDACLKILNKFLTENVDF